MSEKATLRIMKKIQYHMRGCFETMDTRGFVSLS